ncbi:MAG: LacI family DNA-binding transcriptional regulator [Rhodothermales bacterium]
MIYRASAAQRPAKDMRQEATIYDIAKAAGVSIATVSRVFNNSPRVSAATRDRVCASARELGYVPHPSARSLARRQSHWISAVIPMMTSYFYLEVLRGVQDSLLCSDFDLVVHSAASMETIDDQLTGVLQRGRSAGVLLFSTPLEADRLSMLRATRQPVVLVDVYHSAFDSVSIDNELGGYMATRHLIEQGYRRIGIVTANVASVPSVERAQGYRRALREAGIPFEEALVHASDDPDYHGFTEDAGRVAMESFLEMDAPPDAVFAVSDIQALGAMQVVQERGVQGIGLIGFDDIMISKYVGLSTLRQPMYEMGRVALEKLLRRIETPERPISQTHFNPRLVPRASSAPASRESLVASGQGITFA